MTPIASQSPPGCDAGSGVSDGTPAGSGARRADADSGTEISTSNTEQGVTGMTVIDQDPTPPRGILRALEDIGRSHTLLPHGADTLAIVAETEEHRTRYYVVNPANDLQVMVNVWPGGTVDVAFETAPQVFGPPISPRRIEREAVTP